MELTGSRVVRSLVLVERDEYGELEFRQVAATVAICRCQRCGRRARLLPCDVLPRKIYGVAAFEVLMAGYSRGDRSLRALTWCQLGDRTPAHTTLHGWTEGYGQHLLGRGRSTLGGLQWSSFLEAARSRQPEIAELARSEPEPNPTRWRSQARRDRLSAVMRLMALVTVIADAEPLQAMAECRRLSLIWTNVSALEAPSRILPTSIEQTPGRPRARSRAPKTRSPDRCQTRTRSPPAASN